MKQRRITVLLAALALAFAMAIAQDGSGASDAGDGAAPGEQTSLRSESYQLFSLEGSGTTGTLNVTERIEEGTQLVVTLVGIETGDLYLPVLHRGDCGPDRERVFALPPVGSIPDDPFSSISNSSVTFDEISQGDFFLYIFHGGEDGSGAEQESDPIACGEVGEGANR
ncbi:MAG: hypothetical protein WD314_08775 [Trueperaceae bacterium]